MSCRGLFVEADRLLGLVWMVGSGVDLELGEHLSTELALGQHPANLVLAHHLRPALQQRAVGLSLEPAWVTAVPHSGLLLGFATGEDDLLGVGDDHKIATVHMRGVLRAVLAHEDGGDPYGQPAENLTLSIHLPPHRGDVSSLGKIGLARHRSSLISIKERPSDRPRSR